MERRVKERLVGAAVLVAAAVILIPEMLSGPRTAAKAPTTTARNGNEANVKTYTIDLSRSPGVENGAPITESAPPEEIAPPPPENSAAVIEPPTAAPADPRQAVPESEPSSTFAPATTSPPVRSSAPTNSATPNDAPASIASSQPVPTSRGWAVQLGSFASRATAERMANDVESQGRKAFVMPVKSGDSTLYRVRIGPFADRAAAGEALRDVKSRVGNAAVVAHP